MKNAGFCFWFVIVTQIGYCQLAEPLQFQDKTHDFGDVPEHNGPVVYEFSFVNKATRAISILTVQPSCGCTTPGWSKEPIAPGKTGVIKASFDPNGRPGYFNKSLTVSTDLDANPIVLLIKGNVIDKKAEKGPYDLVIINGNLRFRNSSFNVGKVLINREPSSVEFPFFNNGNDTISFLEIVSPPHINLSLPKAISPNSSGKIKITYDAKTHGQFGFVTNSIVIKTTDKIQPEKSFAVYATVEEFFAPLTPEEQSKAPSFVAENYQLDLGKMKDGAEVVRSLNVKNTGKKTLLIRHVQSNCSCLISKISMMNLKPEEVASIEFRFDPTGREGLQNKAVTIYSNDPVNPVQRISVKGYINH